MCYTYTVVKGNSAVDKALLASIKNFTIKLTKMPFPIATKKAVVTYFYTKVIFSILKHC